MTMDKISQFMTKASNNYQHAVKRLDEEVAALRRAEKEHETAIQAQQLLQQAAEAVQREAHRQIASVVSRCLETVFDDPYAFKIHFERKRGKTEARLVFERRGMEVDPVSASGGGVVDVAAFALRLACLVLSRPQKRKFLALDEPWKHLSKEYRPAIRELVLTLAKELGIQFLIVTHSNEFRMGKVIDL